MKWFIVALLIHICFLAKALDVCPLFSDHVVLQREMPIPVWGTGNAGDTISVSLKDFLVNTICNQNGRWETLLPAISGPEWDLVLSISNAKTNIIIRHVAIGDVFVCAGQSNMAYTLERARINGGNMPNPMGEDVRHFKVPIQFDAKPKDQIHEGEWQINNHKSIGSYSAVGYYFGSQVYQHSKIPIGLINIAIGGSKITCWMEEALFAPAWLTNYWGRMQQLQSSGRDGIIRKLGPLPAMVKGEQLSSGLGEYRSVVHTLPGTWEAQGFPHLDGTAFYFRKFEIGSLPDSSDVSTVLLPPIDDADSVWINGQFIGSGDQWQINRRYEFATDLLKLGLNTIAIKVVDAGGGGGVRNTGAPFEIKIKDQQISLSGEWNFLVSEITNNDPVPKRHQPTLCFNGMLNPILRFPVKGVLWYQGESNASSLSDVKQYQDQLEQFITHWRDKSAQPELPFFVVQLPGYEDPRADSPITWALLREAQNEVSKLEDIYLIPAIDCGEKADIHPVQKNTIGDRMARTFISSQGPERNHTYQAPQLSGLRIQKNEFHLKFDFASEGLRCGKTIQKNCPSRFHLIDSAGKKHQVDSVQIDQNKIVLLCPDNIDLTSIQYCWANWPNQEVFIKNAAGLPVVPFQINLK